MKLRLLINRLLALARSRRLDRELEDEILAHLELAERDAIAAGVSPQEARRAARLRFGGIEQMKEEHRDRRSIHWIHDVRQDVKYALRALRKSPGFSTVAILSLALGIGANTTIFTFVNAVLLRPLPYPDSDRLVILREQPRGSEGTVNVHPLNFLEWRARAHSFEALALVQTPPLTVMGATGAEQIGSAQITSELFRVFGVGPVLGREFSEEETRPGSHNVVILGHGFWQRWFGADPGVIGRKLAVREGSLTIVGVAPAGLRLGIMEPDAYTPLQIDPANPGAIGSRSFQCYGRLKPGVSLENARAEMTVIASALSREYRINERFGVFVSTLHDYLVSEGRPALRLLMAVVATVLVIACVNLAGLLIARGMQRRGELAVRASLGASRVRLVRQLVIESLTLAFIGGTAGLVLAYWATQGLVTLTADALRLGTTEPIRLNSTCLVFTLGLSTLTALVFGLVPAWQASRVQPQTALREQTRGATGDRRRLRMKSVLVVTEVALAVVLLVGAGLLLRTFASLVRVDLGFQPNETVTMNLFLGTGAPDARVTLLDQIIERIEAMPGVKAASTIQFLPLAGMTCSTGFRIEGQSPSDQSGARNTDCSLVSRGYFAAMGIPILEGRPFERRDRIGTTRVVIVNQAFARRYFPQDRAIGRRIHVQASNQDWAEIIGVAGDVRHTGLTSEPAPTVFLLHAQTPGYITNLVVRVAGDPSAQAAAIRRAIQEVDPTQAVSNIKTMDRYVDAVLARPRLNAALVTCFAVIAVMLAAMGMHGLIAYMVTQRTHEIGIRLALGATPGKVFFELFRHGAGLVLAGVMAGVLAAMSLRGVLSTFLFGVTTGDPVSYLIAAALFSTVALAAVAIPARRASRVNPLSALRSE